MLVWLKKVQDSKNILNLMKKIFFSTTYVIRKLAENYFKKK